MMAAVLSQAAPEHSAGVKRAGGEAAILYADGSDSHGPVQQSRRRLPASGSGPAGHDTAGLGAGAVALAEPQLQLPEQFDVNLLAPPVLVPAGTKLQALPPWSVGSPVTSPGLTQAGPGPSAAAGPRVAQVVSGSPYTDAYELPDDGGHPHLGGGAAPQPSSREDGGGVAAGPQAPGEGWRLQVGGAAVCEVLNRLQVSDLRPVLHLPLVEAARQLGLHRTSFMTRCRQLGIARWPAKQLRMLDLMEEQLQELEACGVANHYTAKKCLEEAPGWLAQVAAARSALLENPCGFTMPQPLELLRQRHVKVAWAHRQKYKAALGEEGEEGEEGDDLDSQAQMSQ
eukprot:XP_001700326.1 RWP-RK transcription factor [Chlamydomonas reinhardtii]